MKSSLSLAPRADLEEASVTLGRGTTNKGNTSMQRGTTVKSKDNFYSIKLETWITETLHPQEVQQAKKRIDEMYPLHNLPMENLFPILKRCKRKSK